MFSQSLSNDKGRTWGEATATGIPNPDSKVQALRLMSGHLALVFNAHRKLKTVRKARALLDLAISADGDIPTFHAWLSPGGAQSCWACPHAQPGRPPAGIHQLPQGSSTYLPLSAGIWMLATGGNSWVRIARVDGELEPGLRSHYPTMVESEDAQGVRKLYVVYSKFYHEFDAQNRTDLGIQLVEVRARVALRNPSHDSRVMSSANRFKQRVR